MYRRAVRMAYLFNEASDFAMESVAGFAAVYRGRVRQVPGGVVREGRGIPGYVAVVIGGGSGHYPAFGGLVGSGLAHAAAMGNLFASPSAQQVCSVAKAAHSGGGVLLCYGNYAGDVLNFTLAQDQLVAEGIACRTVVVTDDISSAPTSEIAKRRGIAGDLIVFKAAGAAADSGMSLEEVAAIASRANDRTRTLGVAFSGCTLPGADRPLFTVPKGRMAVGMGIHGEPGIGEQDIPSADELAELLVTRLLEEPRAEGTVAEGRRVAVILNGLGSIKNEELFVLYRRVAQILEEHGIEIVDPEVGEMVTSFEMAGVSLTLTWLDSELEALWRASADSPAFRKNLAHSREFASEGQGGAAGLADASSSEVPVASIDSLAVVPLVLASMEALRSAIDDNVGELGRLDAVAGDGDHGIGMKRGADAAAAAARTAKESKAGVGTVLVRAGDAWSDKAGGTSGVLWGILLGTLGTELGDELRPDAHSLARGMRAATDEIVRFGKAQLGDKTLVDVLVPFADSLLAAAARGMNVTDAWGAASELADAAARNTASLVPKIGRARPLAEKSVGTPDPGATSLALAIRAVHRVLTERGVD
jgi:dihydroxyacetone kinase